MKKMLLFLGMISLSFLGYSQTGYETSRNNGVNQTVERYLINSPGNTPGNSRVTWRTHDSTWIEWIFANAYFRNLINSKDDGVPSNMVHTTADGRLLVSPLSYIYPDTINKFVTKSFLSNNNYDKAESDLKYLQSYSELDPTVPSYSKTLNSFNIIKDSTDILYEPIFSKNNAFNKNFGNTLGTITEGNDSRVLNGQTAFSWGNHSIQGYLKGLDTISLSNRINTKLNTSDTISLSNRIDLKQNQLNGFGFVKSNGLNVIYDNSTYLTTEIDGSITNELQNLNLTGNTLSISSGNSVILPTFTQVNSDWNASSGSAQILNKPTIPSQVNLTGSTNTKVTGTYPNIIIADSFTTKVYTTSGLLNQNIKVWTGTVTPSTSNGYSIDISSAGFTTILSTSVIAIRNTSSAASSPNVSIKTKSNTAIVVNVVEDNPATVAILGISVLSGLPSVFANVTGLTLDVTVIGY